MHRPLTLLSIVFSLGILSTPELAEAQPLDMRLFEGMPARSIGPAGMSGRVTAIDVVEADRNVIYAGTASGGLWRSVNGGITFAPLTDNSNIASVGAVAVNQQNPDVIWVGTGEGNPRNSQTGGVGLFKSIDGGETWDHMGLDSSRVIHRILLHPNDPDLVWVGVQGPAWGESKQRGVYRTRDGGETWKRVLYVNSKTGIADLVLDPSNPNKLIAAMWEFRRWPWFFRSGGGGSGIHMTYDGGDSWTKVTDADGLPAGDLGRIGLAIATSSPNVVYAMVEAEQNGFYRSEDGGRTWKRRLVMDDSRARPFYYADIFVDPKNENRVYHIYTEISRSEDGGKSFEKLVKYTGEGVHPDHHAWWIDPDDPDYLINGNDGGLNITRDRGQTWRFVENLPVAQFYHIRVDDEIPYNVYGGMQDNGSWRGPAYVWRHGGIRNSYWEEVAFGDGFDTVPEPSDARFGYAMSQGGYLQRLDTRTGEKRPIRPTHPDTARLRFNWNAAIEVDPKDGTLYYGSQYLHRSRDHGETWEIISPDLTTDDPTKQRQLDSGGLTYDVTAAENFTTIVSIGLSPVEPGVIWVGTDDGNVQITRNDGGSWTNLSDRLTAAPDTGWVTQVRASVHDRGAAYIVIDNHRQEDWEPYIYRTENYGDSFERILAGHDAEGYALSIVEDPVEKRLLFAGTELGLYVSIDGGIGWTRWTSGYPVVSTMDLAIQPRESDLVAGTFGRGAFVLDDLGPLRALASGGLGILDSTVSVFDPPDAYQAVWARASGSRFAADAEYAGENRRRGGQFSFSVAPTDSSDGKATIDVFDEDGNVIRTFTHTVKAGVNRATWDLRRRGERKPNVKAERDTVEAVGPYVAPATYGIRVTFDGRSDSTSMVVNPDPRIAFDENAEAERQDAFDVLLSHIETATRSADRLRSAQKTVERIDAMIEDREDEAADQVRAAGDTVAAALDSLLALFTDPKVKGIRSNPMTVSARLNEAQSYLNVVGRQPGQGFETSMQHAVVTLERSVEAVNAFFERDWPDYRLQVEDAQVSPFGESGRIEMPAFGHD